MFLANGDPIAGLAGVVEDLIAGKRQIKAPDLNQLDLRAHTPQLPLAKRAKSLIARLVQTNSNRAGFNAKDVERRTKEFAAVLAA